MRKWREGVGLRFLIAMQAGSETVVNTGLDKDEIERRAKQLAEQFPNTSVVIYEAKYQVVASSPKAEIAEYESN
jgi:hypothetical protein